MGGMVVIPRKKHNRIIEEKDEEINNLKKTIEQLEAKVKKLNSVEHKLESSKEQISKLMLENFDLNENLEESKRKIFILTNLLKFDADKNIKRYENIKRRTKKSRVKDKCDIKIEDYMMRKIVYERVDT